MTGSLVRTRSLSWSMVTLVGVSRGSEGSLPYPVGLLKDLEEPNAALLKVALPRIPASSTR